MNERDLIDVGEASRLTGLTSATLYRLSRQGRLRAFRVLRRALRFDRADVLALVEEKAPPASDGSIRSGGRRK